MNLCRHDFGIRATDFQSSIHAGGIVRVDYVTTEHASRTNSTIVSTLLVGIPTLWPAVRVAVGREHRIPSVELHQQFLDSRTGLLTNIIWNILRGLETLPTQPNSNSFTLAQYRTTRPQRPDSS
jgi:hypothetical protein